MNNFEKIKTFSIETMRDFLIAQTNITDEFDDPEYVSVVLPDTYYDLEVCREDVMDWLIKETR